MSNPRHCANCKAPLPSDWPADNHYCAACNAAWRKGQSEREHKSREGR